jgi:hypothetical protein
MMFVRSYFTVLLLLIPISAVAQQAATTVKGSTALRQRRRAAGKGKKDKKSKKEGDKNMLQGGGGGGGVGVGGEDKIIPVGGQVDIGGQDVGTDNGDDKVGANGTVVVEDEGPYCIAAWSGFGTLPSEPGRTPAGMEPGDCRSSDHCGGPGQDGGPGQVKVCCKYPVQVQTHISSILRLLTYYFDTFQSLGQEVLCICRPISEGVLCI